MAKAGRPKKGSTGLPDWFDIRNYSSVKNFKTLDWYQQLVIRCMIYEYYRVIDLKDIVDESWALVFDLIKADPIITRERILDAKIRFQEERGQHSEDAYLLADGIALLFTTDVFGINDAKHRDIYTAYRMFPDIYRKYLTESDLECAGTFNEILWNPQRPAAEMIDVHCFLDSRYEYSKQGLITVDLTLPDAVLKHQFEAYLKKKRKRFTRPASPFFKSPDFKSWYNNGCLPYLDLMLLERSDSAAFRWSAFADALNKIVDKPVGSESALTKTCSKLADKLLTTGTIRMLQTQAASEENGLTEKSGKLIVR